MIAKKTIAQIFGALFISAFFSPPAIAHKFTYPKTLRLLVTETDLVLGLSFDVNPGNEAHWVRTLFDRDSNGTLDAHEQEMVVAYLEKTATLWLEVFMGDKKLELRPKRMRPNRVSDPTSSTETLGIALEYVWPLEKRENFIELRLEDRNKDLQADVPLWVQLQKSDVVELANQGEFYSKNAEIRRVSLTKGRSFILKVHRP